MSKYQFGVRRKEQDATAMLAALLKRQLCGADAIATFPRDEFGLDAGKSYGFSMEVTLRIQVEALKND